MLGNATLKTNSLVDINSRTDNHEEALEVNFEGPQPSIRNLKKKARFDSVPNRYQSSSLNHSQEPARQARKTRLLIQPPVFEKYKVVNKAAFVTGQDLWMKPHRSTNLPGGVPSYADLQVRPPSLLKKPTQALN